MQRVYQLGGLFWTDVIFVSGIRVRAYGEGGHGLIATTGDDVMQISYRMDILDRVLGWLVLKVDFVAVLHIMCQLGGLAPSLRDDTRIT